jgi:hypothetical protein
MIMVAKTAAVAAAFAPVDLWLLLVRRRVADGDNCPAGADLERLVLLDFG